MEIKDKKFKKMVDVCEEGCQYRKCYWPRPDPGVFTQGQGYSQRSDKQEWLCGEREARGCPSPKPEIIEPTKRKKVKL